jgi:serine/threonine protein kinase
MTHARTMQVCGTGPYMPPEYVNRGEVSARTDAFAFGIMAIELLTGLHPVMVRELVDTHLFEELPQMIQKLHDGKPHELTVVRGPKPIRTCKWPAAPLKRMSMVAAKCVWLQPIGFALQSMMYFLNSRVFPVARETVYLRPRERPPR